ncbi:MAG: hypothetical protein ABI407_03465 [Bradyrhizobium sp.]
MKRNGWMQTVRAAPAARLRVAWVLAVAAAVLSGCGGGSTLGATSNSSPSIGDRFSQLFGSKSQAVGEAAPPPAAESDLTCPPVTIRAGASTYTVAAPGKEPVGNDVRYQEIITRTARDCTLNNGQITARIGIQGRVIAGPAGSPASIEVPLRVAVVQGGVQEKTIATKVYRTTVVMNEEGSAPFSLVAEDMVYPAPTAAAGDAYIFYIGFDPQALKPEPKAKRRKK